MRHKQLSALIALSLGFAASVQAQDDYDTRWYVAPYMGYNHNDEDRFSDDGTLLLGMGIGRYLNDHTTLDVFVDRTQRGADEAGRILFGTDDAMDSTMYGVAVRYYFRQPDLWRPYIMAGMGMINHRNGAEDGWDPGFQIGGGFQKAFTDNVNFRTELVYRHDMDGDSVPFDDNFGDWQVNVGVTMAIGSASEPMPDPDPTPAADPTPQPESDCSKMDDDQDGVNNCDDKCAGTPAGTIVGPDGCEQKVVIDLRGVNFLFDRPKRGQEDDIDGAGLLPGSKEILDQAVDVLQRYPNVTVEVAGHTDWIGTDAYNQSLSERRARTVYNYLVSKGVDAERLKGPMGYGESKPIDTNETKEGRQRNRRTELDVQQ